MTQIIEFDGKQHAFPDDFSQSDISNALVSIPATPDFVPAQNGQPMRLTVRPNDPSRDIQSQIGMGMVRGLRDIPDQGAAMLTHGLEGLAPEGSWFQKFMQGQRELVDKINTKAETDYQKNWLGGQPSSAADVGRIGGNVLGGAPIAASMPGATAAGVFPRMLSGFTSGGITGALQPPTEAGGNFWDQKINQATSGAIGGGIAPAVVGGFARVVSPNTNPDVRSLMQQGVRTTPGQTLGGAINRIEEGLQSIPLLGDVVRNARLTSQESFNRAAINRALEPIGQALPHNVPMGRQAIDHAHDAVSTAYNNLLPQLRVQADPQFVHGMQGVLGLATHLEPDYAKTFQKILQDKVFHRFAPNGGMTGTDFKKIESVLGTLAKNYSASPMAGEKELGGALRQVQAELRDLLMRSNPNHADRLRDINNSFAHLVRVEGAAAKTGTEQGQFTPAQLLSAVRSADPSIRKNQFARGDALMQDLADQGRTVLGSKVPDSGTPFRAMVGAGGILGLGMEPTGAGLGALAGGGLLAGLYTGPGTAAARAVLARRPDFAPYLASLMRSQPFSTPLGAALMQPGSNQ